ncbi:MAG TPA: hydrogen peroxide-dependent heme synthase [Limnochordia bacterium]|nr:hydrogen peroxide-dependent heme synthase [Limnochordia bacterium]
MSEQPHQTLEGWFCLHDVRRFDWARWKALSPSERAAAAEEAVNFAERALGVADDEVGASGLFSLLGHKGDLLWVHLRPTLEALHALEVAFAQTRLADFTERSYAYVSVTELSQYTTGDREPTPQMQAFIERRLKPDVPDWPYIAIYPMSKRRTPEDNWYMLDEERRRELMRSHGKIGRGFAGEVQQMICGSMGYDDWEWFVTLYAMEPLPLKKVVQEMRFDEASARYAEFGPFFTGLRLDPAALPDWLNGRVRLRDA